MWTVQYLSSTNKNNNVSRDGLKCESPRQQQRHFYSVHSQLYMEERNMNYQDSKSTSVLYVMAYPVNNQDSNTNITFTLFTHNFTLALPDLYCVTYRVWTGLSSLMWPLSILLPFYFNKLLMDFHWTNRGISLAPAGLFHLSLSLSTPISAFFFFFFTRMKYKID